MKSINGIFDSIFKSLLFASFPSLNIVVVKNNITVNHEFVAKVLSQASPVMTTSILS